MKLESSGGMYVKFPNIGDKVIGHFVSYLENQGGAFGPENILTLKNKDGEVRINCRADLKNKIGQNKALLPGKVIKITYVEDKVIAGKPQPMKVFDVQADDPKPGTKVPPPAPTPPTNLDADDEELAF